MNCLTHKSKIKQSEIKKTCPSFYRSDEIDRSEVQWRAPQWMKSFPLRVGSEWERLLPAVGVFPTRRFCFRRESPRGVPLSHFSPTFHIHLSHKRNVLVKIISQKRLSFKSCRDSIKNLIGWQL
mgnify:CR=1 FL=1